MADELLARLSGGSLLPAIVQDVATKEVLMLAWVNLEALELSRRTGRA
ncbi:MAG: hypothetical protein RLZZ19_158, partial [Actinomycetota bacterium]